MPIYDYAARVSADDDKIRALLDERGELRNRDVAEALGITRQAAYKRLRGMVERGELVPEGAGRSARYVPTASARAHARYPTEGLAEEQVWEDLVERVPALARLSGNARNVFNYALTELVNNAIDHSGSDVVEVEVREEGTAVILEVIDRGVGTFAHLRDELGLPSELHALQELSKGKTTTMPERHTGEGIFFTSKAADRFELRSGALGWIVDNQLGDTAVEQLSVPVRGTHVLFAADPETVRDLTELFQEYTENYEFSKTRTVVKLFAIGVRFISRSEAKRLVHRLDEFREVVLDFQGVTAIGQGFADEVFRVWAKEHPETELVPVNMIEPVEFMVRRVIG
jgi:anti-sigma regulatory factor (Ser/Thr protein kinase)